MAKRNGKAFDTLPGRREINVATILHASPSGAMDEDQPGFDYAVRRLGRIAFPRLTITRPAAEIIFERDVAIPMRGEKEIQTHWGLEKFT